MIDDPENWYFPVQDKAITLLDNDHKINRMNFLINRKDFR